MRVVFLIGMRMVLAMVGNPADRPTLRGTCPDRGQDVLEPPGTQCKAPMSQQAMIGHADPDPTGQPVQQQANGQAGPGKIGRNKTQKGTEVHGSDPNHGSPRQPCGAGSTVVVVVIINLWSSTSRRID